MGALPRAEHGGPAGALLEVYYWQRVAITIEVERIVAYPDDAAPASRQVLGDRAAGPAPPADAAADGTGPRVDAGTVAAHASGCRTRCSAGAVRTTCRGRPGRGGRGRLTPGVAASRPAAARFRAGGSRAGLTSHWFQPRMIGQEQRVHTGWLEDEGDRGPYSPHTKAGYRLPASKVAVHARQRHRHPAGNAQGPRARPRPGVAQAMPGGTSRIFSSSVPGRSSSSKQAAASSSGWRT